jgi:energy-coupling factor transport system ATP-binding protein
MILLQAESLSFRYSGDTPWLFRDLSIAVKSGDVTVLTGVSGSGKTTLLYLLSGVIPRHKKGEIIGVIRLKGCNHQEDSLARLAPNISLVMQNPQQQLFFPTVEQELAFAPENLCLPADEIESLICETLEILHISELRFQLTNQLSYGQQKLVALAAVYTLQPGILLLDEISNGLSEHYMNHVCNLIKAYTAKGNAVIMAEHDSPLLELAHKTIHLG